jgi:hypothetical protein
VERGKWEIEVIWSRGLMALKTEGIIDTEKIDSDQPVEKFMSSFQFCLVKTYRFRVGLRRDSKVDSGKLSYLMN